VNFALSEDQEMVRAAVERFVGVGVGVGVGTVEGLKAARKMPGGVDRKRWTELADVGLLSLDDIIDCAVIAETLG
jgi:hypothetical protein